METGRASSPKGRDEAPTERFPILRVGEGELPIGPFPVPPLVSHLCLCVWEWGAQQMLIHPWNSWNRKLFWDVFAFRCWLKVCDGSWVLEYWSNNLSHFRASRSLQMGTKEFQGWEGAWETLGTLPKECPHFNFTFVPFVGDLPQIDEMGPDGHVVDLV